MKKVNLALVFVFLIGTFSGIMLSQYELSKVTVIVAYGVGVCVGMMIHIALSYNKTNTEIISMDSDIKSESESTDINKHNYIYYDTKTYLSDKLEFRKEFLFTCTECHENTSLLLKDIAIQVDNAEREIKRLDTLGLADDIQSMTIYVGDTWTKDRYIGKHITLVVDYYKTVFGIDLTSIPA